MKKTFLALVTILSSAAAFAANYSGSAPASGMTTTKSALLPQASPFTIGGGGGTQIAPSAPVMGIGMRQQSAPAIVLPIPQ